jgi:hypothetical protein
VFSILDHFSIFHLLICFNLVTHDAARKNGVFAATLFFSKSGKIKRGKMWNRLKDMAVLRDTITEACIASGCDSSSSALECLQLDSSQWQSLALPTLPENSDFAKWDQAADLCLLWTVWMHGIAGKLRFLFFPCIMFYCSDLSTGLSSQLNIIDSPL